MRRKFKCLKGASDVHPAVLNCWQQHCLYRSILHKTMHRITDLFGVNLWITRTNGKGPAMQCDVMTTSGLREISLADLRKGGLCSLSHVNSCSASMMYLFIHHVTRRFSQYSIIFICIPLPQIIFKCFHRDWLHGYLGMPTLQLTSVSDWHQRS